MFIVGIIKNDSPRALINPVVCRDQWALYVWLKSFLNDENYILDKPLTEEILETSLQSDVPVLIPFNGYKASLMFAKEEVIEANTDQFIHTDLFNYTDYMAD